MISDLLNLKGAADDPLIQAVIDLAARRLTDDMESIDKNRST